MDRWSRLERYARFKSKLAFHALPDEIISYIMSRFLTFDDVCRLLEAYVGRPLNFDIRQDVVLVPDEFRGTWIVHNMRARIVWHLHAMADTALYAIRHGGVAYAVADWSPFSPTEAVPIALYGWCVAPRVTRIVELNERAIDELMLSASRKATPVVRINLHHVLLFPSQSVWCAPPIHGSDCQLYPPFFVH